MDIRLPDGTVVQGVPDGISKAEFVAGLKSRGYDVSKLEPKPERGAIENLAAGGARGVRDVIDRPAELLPRGLSYATSLGGAAPNAVSEWLAKQADQVAAGNEQDLAKYEADTAGSIAAPIGRFGGNMVATAPVAPLAGAGLAGLGAATGARSLQALGQATANYGFGARAAEGAAANALTKGAGGAIAGGLSAAAIDPESAGTGAAIGAVLPGIGAAANALGRGAARVVEPFTERGAERIAGRTIEGAATDKAALVDRLANPPPAVARQTLAEVADDPGISSLQRTLANRPEIGNALAAVKQEQNAARSNAFGQLAGDEKTIAKLEAERDQATSGLLAKLKQDAGEVGTMGVRSKFKELGEGADWERSAVRSSLTKAAEPFRTPDGRFASKVQFDKAWGARRNIDDMLAGIGDDATNRAARASARQLGEVRERLTTALEKAAAPGDFKAYTGAYAEKSAPIDAARTLQDLLKRTQTGTQDTAGNLMLSGPKLQNAMKNLDPRDLSKLSGQQRQTLEELANELSRAGRADTMGKAVGSNTVQNMLAAERILPAGLLRFGGPIGSMAKGAVNLAFKDSNEKIATLLGNGVINPKEAARLIQLANTPYINQLLAARLNQLSRRAGASAPLLSTNSHPAEAR